MHVRKKKTSGEDQRRRALFICSHKQASVCVRVCVCVCVCVCMHVCMCVCVCACVQMLIQKFGIEGWRSFFAQSRCALLLASGFRHKRVCVCVCVCACACVHLLTWVLALWVVIVQIALGKVLDEIKAGARNLHSVGCCL